MLFVLLLLVRVLARLLVLQGTDGGTKDLEILVLRHQLRVLRRKTGRPRFTTLDRIVLAAASRVLPPDRWASFLVTPQTLLRWHRMLVRSKWTSPRGRRPGRPAIDPEVAASSCGWQGRTPDGAASESPGRNVARQNRKSTVSGQASASDPPRFSRLQGVTAGTPTTLLHLATSPGNSRG